MLEKMRTTIAFEPSVYDEAKQTYEGLGFRKMGDMVNEAVREYLVRQRTRRKDLAMQEAARDGAYRAVLREVSGAFAVVDSEGLPEY